MRRSGVVVIGCAVLLLLSAGGASAHPFLEPALGRVGTRATFALKIDSPAAAITSVDVALPSDFRVDHVADVAGWTREDRAGGVRFRGTLAAGKVVSIEVTGTPTRKGVVVFPVTTVSATGETMAWTAPCTDQTAPFKGAQLIVDVDPATACDPAPKPRSPVRSLALGLVAAGLVLGAAYPVIKRARERQGSA
jgi:hypothetical protein